MDININTGTKWTTLAISTAVLVLLPFDGTGIYVGCSWWVRLTYPLFHANLLHAFCNAWCLISLVFYYDLNFRKIFTAYIIAVTIPNFVLSATPAIGLSGVCFALMGLTFFVVKRQAMFMAWVMAFLAAGALMPGIAAAIHTYCYAAGLVAGLFTSPIKHRQP